MGNAKRLVTLLVFIFFPIQSGWALERGVVLVTSLPDGETQVEGEENLKMAEVSPASTFKVVLAWAGLAERAIDLEKRVEVGDRHVPGTPRAIGLEEAMYYSSNDFFIPLARQLGRERLVNYMVRCGLFGEDIPDDWLGEDWWPVVKAGKLTVTAERNHGWMSRVAQGRGIEPESVHRDLIQSLSWPSSAPSVRLYGKTGVYGGAVWFNGFGVRDTGKLTVVTVMLQGSVERRNEAINEFYRRFDMRWDEEMKSRRPEPDGRK